jgi:type I restriction-modification system DNA methylase subunit
LQLKVEMNYRGSQSQDWCARCDWAVSEPVSPEQSEAFLKNILWELSPEEAVLAKGILTHGTLNEAARAQGVDKARARNLMLQARKRLNRLGISPEFLKKGMMI